jgi:hypothetical protein
MLLMRNFTEKKIMTQFISAYDSLAEFMAGLDPVKVLAFHAPEALQNRVEELLDKKQEIGLSEEEQSEMDHYLIYEHIVRLAKSRARLQLSKVSA